MQESTQSDMEEAKKWFNDMDNSTRNQLVLTIYRLCIYTKETSHEKLAESLNAQWTEKCRSLQMENDVLQQNQQQHISVLVDSIRQMESKLNDSVNSIALKITPSSNGKLGENFIEELLGKIPDTELINIAQYKGGGDFLYIHGDFKVMIESKNWTDSSIKGNPKEFLNFKETAIQAKEDNKIDYAIMALHRVSNLKGKGVSMETVYTRNGPLLLLYVTNLFVHPERLLYAIDAGMLLLRQKKYVDIDSNKFILKLENFMKSIETFSDSIKERTKVVKTLSELIKNDSKELENMRTMIDNIVNNTDKLPLKDRVVNMCVDYIVKNNNDESVITKVFLEKELADKDIPLRFIREHGGVKAIRKMAIDKVKNVIRLND